MKTYRNGMLLAVAVSLALAFVLVMPVDAMAHPLGLIAGHDTSGLLWAIPAAIAMDSGASLKALREQRSQVVKDMRALLDKAETEDRDFSDEEKATFDGFKAKKEQLDTRIERYEGVADAEADLERTRPAHARSQGIDPARRHGEASKEFDNFGEFMYSVRFRPRDQRLNFVEGVGSGEDMSGDLNAANDMRMDSGATGGFMIPPQFRADLFQQIRPQDALVRPRAFVIPAGEPPDAPITFPVLDQSGAAPGNTYGGVQVQWIAEGAQKPQTDASIGDVTLEPHEVAGHVVVTDKLLRNWIAAGAVLERLLRGAVISSEDFAFLRGNGVGKPLGIINAPATYKINRATANHIVYLDLVDMVARLLMRGGNPIWSMPQQALPEIATLKDPLGNYIWKPIGTDDANAALGFAGQLLGYPLRWNNRSPALGSLGDVTIADYSMYMIKDGSGPFVAASEHVYFTQNKTVIKIFWNVDGTPWLNAPFTEENGYQVSPFVALDVPTG